MISDNPNCFPFCFSENSGMELTPKLVARVIDERGLQKQGLADALGIPNSAVTSYLRGERALKQHEIPLAKKYLQLDSVPIVGKVSAGAAMMFFPQTGEWERVPAPDDATDKTVAAEIDGTSLGPILDRWLVYYDRVERPVTKTLIGQLCVVGLPDGRVLVKQIKESRTEGLFHLFSNTNEDPILDQEIEWAAKVRSISPRKR